MGRRSALLRLRLGLLLSFPEDQPLAIIKFVLRRVVECMEHGRVHIALQGSVHESQSLLRQDEDFRYGPRRRPGVLGAGHPVITEQHGQELGALDGVLDGGKLVGQADFLGHVALVQRASGHRQIGTNSVPRFVPYPRQPGRLQPRKWR